MRPSGTGFSRVRSAAPFGLLGLGHAPSLHLAKPAQGPRMPRDHERRQLENEWINGSTCSVGFNNCVGCRELLRSRHSLFRAYERLPGLNPAFTDFPIWDRQVHILLSWGAHCHENNSKLGQRLQIRHHFPVDVEEYFQLSPSEPYASRESWDPHAKTIPDRATS